FYDWYRDSNRNTTILQRMVLQRQQNGSYEFDRPDDPSNPNDGFFPIDNAGFGVDGSSPARNFHFTSEVRYWFEYRGGEVLNFRGDDDVWVFIKGQLALDLGGVHSALEGRMTLQNGRATTRTQYHQTRTDIALDEGELDLGLEEGKVYEIVVFQAERHTTESSYRLTLTGFNADRTLCRPECGNGIVTPDEACDLGPGKNTGEHGGCNPDCTLAPYCGDGKKNGKEECDNGINTSTYDSGGNACAPGCVLPPRCGDGQVQGAYEQCDDGEDNGAGYGFCTKQGTLGPRCGDGIVQTPHEECDDVRNGVNYNRTSGSKCSATCTLKCGNGVVDPGEECDDGDHNGDGYGKCTTQCRLGPHCGDGIRQRDAGEECDDGKNDGSYGMCAPGCKLGPRCGDGKVQADEGEICDAGAANSADAYGKNLCTVQCRPAPYCGDRAVDVAFGEQCDDGKNDGTPGSCEPDCSGWVPLPKCGDGKVDAG